MNVHHIILLYSWVFVLLLASCNGTPGNKVVDKIKDSQPTGIKPLQEASTEYPPYLQQIGLVIPSRTTLMEAGKQYSNGETAITSKLISNLSVRDLHSFYRTKVGSLQDFVLTTDKFFDENSGDEVGNRFIIYALNGKNYLMVSGSPAYGAPNKTQVTISYRSGSDLN